MITPFQPHMAIARDGARRPEPLTQEDRRPALPAANTHLDAVGGRGVSVAKARFRGESRCPAVANRLPRALVAGSVS
jgi:hypothetical protein